MCAGVGLSSATKCFHHHNNHNNSHHQLRNIQRKSSKFFSRLGGNTVVGSGRRPTKVGSGRKNSARKKLSKIIIGSPRKESMKKKGGDESVKRDSLFNETVCDYVCVLW